MRHPSQQTLRRAKGQILRQQTDPFLQAPRGDLSFMFRQTSIARQCVPLIAQKVTHLARQLHYAQPAGDFQQIVSIPNYRASLLLAKFFHQQSIGQPPLFHHQMTHRFPASLAHLALQLVQVMRLRNIRQVHLGHGLSPQFSQGFRVVKFVNFRYHQYQLTHVGLPMFASRRCRDIEDTRRSQFSSKAHPIGLAR